MNGFATMALSVASGWQGVAIGEGVAVLTRVALINILPSVSRPLPNVQPPDAGADTTKSSGLRPLLSSISAKNTFNTTFATFVNHDYVINTR